MIELKDVTAGYGAQPVLNHVSAAFEKGKVSCIIGVNGSGKTTLLKAMLAMVPVNGGQILLDGCSADTMSRREIARKAAWLSQGKDTPDMTVEQLVLHGRFPHLNYPRRYTEHDHRIAADAMERLGLGAVAARPLHTLSGGMRQNAYIAMALAQDTDYILLDEPTTYLDIGRQLELMKTLRALADSGKGIVAVMHDLPMAFRFSDWVVHLHGGEVAARGTPRQVCHQETIRRCFGVALSAPAEGATPNYQYEI